MPGGDHREAVTTLFRRKGLLDFLREEPAHVRDLIDETGSSRATIHRALGELEELGCVERGEDGMTITLRGRILRDQLEALLSGFEHLEAAAPVVEPLPGDAAVDPMLLTKAEWIGAAAASRHRVLDRLHEDLMASSSCRAVVPALGDSRTVSVLYEHVVTEGAPADVVVPEPVFEALRADFPRRLSAMAAEEHFTLAVGETPSYGLWLLEVPEGTTGDPVSIASLLVFEPDGGIHGLLVNRSPAAVAWAEERLDGLNAGAADRTDGLVAETDGGTTVAAGQPASMLDRAIPVSLEREGFVRVDAAYFRDAPVASPAEAWRAGLSIAEVHTGFAIGRRIGEHTEKVGDGVLEDVETAFDAGDGVRGEAGDGGRGDAGDDEFVRIESEERHDLSENVGHLSETLEDILRSGGDAVVLGPPGSGKSTTCKRVACRWYEADRGPVYYREGGRGRPFEAVADLVAAVEAADGHPLIVVEDAVRRDARTVFEAIDRLEERERVSVLLDSRENEWRDRPPTLDADTPDPEVVHVPPMRRADCRRLVDHFERTTTRPVDVAADRLWREVRDETHTNPDGASHGMVRAIHRLATYADPLASGPTALEEAVAEVYEDLAEEELVLSVAVLANLLNAAGLEIRRPLFYALGEPGALDAIDDAIDRLEGQMLFGSADGRFRIVHEEWSTAFLAHLLAADGEERACRRFADTLGDVLSLADDEERTGLIASHLAEPSPLSFVVDDPGGWSADVVAAIYDLVRERSQLAPLFGDGDRDPIALPDACSGELREDRRIWLGEAFLAGGYNDRAARAFERIDAERFEGERLLGLARVCLARSDYDGAIEHGRACLAADPEGVIGARARKCLGTALLKQGKSEDSEQHFRAALEVFEAEDHRRWTAETRLGLGELAFAIDEYDRAREHFEAALALMRDLGDRRGEADALSDLAGIPWRRGEYDRARALYEQSLDIHRRRGDRRGEATTLFNLGLIETATGAYDDARRLLERSVERYRTLGERLGEAKSLQMLGIIAGREGDPGALQRYERSLEIYREIDAPHDEIVVGTNLTDLLRLRGEYERAHVLAEGNLELAERLEDPRGQALTLKSLGVILREFGDYERAGGRLEEGLAIVEPIDERVAEARLTRELGLLALRRGRYKRAGSLLERSYDHCHAMGQRRGEVKTLIDRGILALKQDANGRARELLERGLDVAADAGEANQTARARRWLAELDVRTGALDGAVEHLEAGREAVAESGYTVETRLALTEARLAWRRQEYEEADRLARGALETFEEIGAPLWQARSRRLRGCIAASRGDQDAAREHLADAASTFEDIGAAADALETLGMLADHNPEDVAAYRQRARDVLERTPSGAELTATDWIDSGH